MSSNVWKIMGLVPLVGCGAQGGAIDVADAIDACYGDAGWVDSDDCGRLHDALLSVSKEAVTDEAVNAVTGDELAAAVLAQNPEDLYAGVAKEITANHSLELGQAVVEDAGFVGAPTDAIAAELVRLADATFLDSLAGGLVNETNKTNFGLALVGAGGFYDGVAGAVVTQGDFYGSLATSLMGIGDFLSGVGEHLTYSSVVGALPSTFAEDVAAELSGDTSEGGFVSAVAGALDWVALAKAILASEDLPVLTDGVADGLAAEHVDELTSDLDLQDALGLDLAGDTGFVADVAEAVEPALSADGSTLRAGVAGDLAGNDTFKGEVTAAALASLSGTEIVGMIDTYTLETGAFPWNAEVVAAVDGEVGSVGRSGVTSLALAVADYASSSSVTAVSNRVTTIEGDYLRTADKTVLQAADSALGERLDAIEGADYQTGADVLTTLGSYATTAALNAVGNRVTAIEGDYLRAADRTALQSADSALDVRVDAIEAAHYQTASDVNATLAGFTFPTAWNSQVQSAVNAQVAAVGRSGVSTMADVVNKLQTASDVGLTLSSYTFPAAWKTQVDAEVGGIMGDLVDLVEAGSVEFDPAQALLTFSAINVRIVNGGDSTATTNGTGNLILGYDEDDGADTKTGSHNLIVGSGHTYTGYGNIVSGYDSTVEANYAGTFGGYSAFVYANYAATLAGAGNELYSVMSAAVGGAGNEVIQDDATATGYAGVAVGGQATHVSGEYAVVSGGSSNYAIGAYSSVSGGEHNRAEWSGTWVGGGQYNRAGYHDDGSGDVAAVVGGYNNWAGHEGSVVVGGEGNAYALIDSTAEYSVTP